MQQNDRSLADGQVPCHVCASTPGDCILFDQACFHASFGGEDGRRMSPLTRVLSFCCCPPPSTFSRCINSDAERASAK